jgi:hypothetical protein
VDEQARSRYITAIHYKELPCPEPVEEITDERKKALFGSPSPCARP